MLTQETEDYWIWNVNTFVFKSEFNKPLDDYINIISKYDKLIFSNYSNVKIYMETNNQLKSEFYKYYLKSKFNQEVNNLSPNITHLTFGWQFNQEVNNLPQNLTHLTFGYDFNQEVAVPSVKRKFYNNEYKDALFYLMVYTYNNLIGNEKITSPMEENIIMLSM